MSVSSFELIMLGYENLYEIIVEKQDPKMYINDYLYKLNLPEFEKKNNYSCLFFAIEHHVPIFIIKLLIDNGCSLLQNSNGFLTSSLFQAFIFYCPDIPYACEVVDILPESYQFEVEFYSLFKWEPNGKSFINYIDKNLLLHIINKIPAIHEQISMYIGFLLIHERKDFFSFFPLLLSKGFNVHWTNEKKSFLDDFKKKHTQDDITKLLFLISSCPDHIDEPQ